MSGTFQFNGVVSGLNTQAIIQALLAPDQQQIANITAQQTTIQNKDGAFRDINAKLATLQSSVQQLQLQSVLLAKAATINSSSTTPIVSATASSGAANGTFNVTVKQLATATTVASSSAVGQAITPYVPLASAGFVTPPTTGYFSIGNTQIQIDANTVLSDGAGDAPGVNSILSKINNSGTGVTASFVNDSSGRANLLELTSASPIHLGTAGDTSNFLTISNLIAASPPPGSNTLTSTSGLASVSPTALLQTARQATALSASAGSFSVNGVAVNYDATQDTLNDVLSRINASTAGVSASYDPVADKVIVRNQHTGSIGVQLQDTSGNFLAAFNLANANQTYGQNAAFSIDTVNGGQTMTSTTNAVSGIVPGVTLNLLSAAPGTPVSVTIGADTASTTAAMQTFVSAFNGVLDLIKSNTSYNSGTKQSGLLFTDSTIYSISSELFDRVFVRGSGQPGSISTASDIGLSTGAVGSTPGSTNDLVLDTNKFSAALSANPDALRLFMQGPPGTIANGLLGTLNTYLNNLTSSGGLFATRLSSDDTQVRSLGAELNDKQSMLDAKQAALVQQYAAMESTLSGLQSQAARMGAQLGTLNGSSSSSSTSTGL